MRTRKLKKMETSHKELIYLAAPYSDPDELRRVQRFNMINRAAAKLMAEGKYVFSPISHTHPIKEAGNLPGGWEYWEGYDRRMISCCDKLIVLMLDGWDKSVGVQAEIKIAAEMGLPIEYMLAVV